MYTAEPGVHHACVSGSRMKRFKSVVEWGLHEIQSRRDQGDSGRQRLCRVRRRRRTRLPARLAGGRPLQARATTASQERRHRRWAACTARLLPEVANELQRVRVVAKTRLAAASDVRRALRFAREMRATSRHLVSLLLALWYERAWRNPVLSRAFLHAFQRQCASGHTPLAATWLSIMQTRRLAPRVTPNFRFWHGPNAFNAAAGPWVWQPRVLEHLLRDISRHRTSLDAGVYAAKLSALPYVSAYNAFAYLRTLQALGCMTLRKADVAAAAMSSTVAALTRICPLSSWCRGIRWSSYSGGLLVQPGDAALVVCETAKAVNGLGFAVPKDSKVSIVFFVRAFGSGNGRNLLLFLRKCKPLSEASLRREEGVRSTEARLVDQYFPRTRAAWDRAPHVCRGSESLVRFLRQQLESQGFLISSGVCRK